MLNVGTLIIALEAAPVMSAVVIVDAQGRRYRATQITLPVDPGTDPAAPSNVSPLRPAKGPLPVQLNVVALDDHAAGGRDGR